MDRRHFLTLLGVMGGAVSLRSWSDDAKFEQFLKDQNGGFSAYQARLEKDFNTYLSVTAQEFARYQKRVKAVWGDEQLGNAKVLVSYSQDLKTRTVINYEAGTVLVETLAASDSKQAQQELMRTLIQNAHADTQSFYANSELDRAIQASLEKNTKLNKKAQLDKKYLIADALTGKTRPTSTEIDAAVLKASKQATAATQITELGQKVYSLSIPLTATQMHKKADSYRATVTEFAKKEGLNPALVLAIIHTESAFNPMARSPVPAFGLMQIVPTSAGKDASAYVYGKASLLTPSYLYNSENNIKMGCAYLHILYFNYLSSIEDSESRLYCTIAAYNTGAGNVARAFSGNANVKQAAVLINKMQPSEVYRHLQVRLPYQETRDYVERVNRRYQSYLA
jgi:membrane-bound lytic murein transglycosylase C